MTPQLTPAALPPDLVARYSTRGPRYTSYPPAPHFSPEFDRAALAERYRTAGRAVSLYAHVPFCQVRCGFCGCHVEITRDRERIDAYAGRLLDEFALYRGLMGDDHEVDQIAFGGGTPSEIGLSGLRALMKAIAAAWPFTPGAEKSIELDPRRIDEDFLDGTLDMGFNRFSFGVQDVDPDVAKGVNRRQTLDQTTRAVRHLQGRGMTAINVDLMYGLPGQTLEGFDASINEVIALRPSRLAVFGYAHVPWLKPHQKLLEKQGLPGPELRAALFDLAFRKLTGAGWQHIGMDHFALPDDEMARALADRTLHRNFMGYTTRRGLDQVALGVSAIGAVNGTYAQNTKDLHVHAEALARGDMPWERAYFLSADDLVRRDLITELFCNLRLDIRRFERTHGIDFAATFAPEWERLAPMEADGLLVREAEVLELTDVGRFFVRNVCMVFDRYLESEPGLRRYSQTV